MAHLSGFKNGGPVEQLQLLLHPAGQLLGRQIWEAGSHLPDKCRAVAGAVE